MNIAITFMWMVIPYTSIECYTAPLPQTNTEYVLRPAAGALFRRRNNLNSYGKTIYITVSIQIPKHNFKELIPPDMYCPNELVRNNLTRYTSNNICSNYNASLDTFRETIEFYNETYQKTMSDIFIILGENKAKRRERRFLPIIPFAIAAAKGVFGLINSVTGYIRNKALTNSIKDLEHRQTKLNDLVLNYEEKTALYNAHMNDNVQNLQKQILIANEEVRQFANKTTSRLSELYKTTESRDANRRVEINILSTLQSHSTSILAENLAYLFMHQNHVNQFLLGSISLKKGILSSDLVSPTRLEEILTKTNEEIKQTTAEKSKLVSTNPVDYYQRADISYKLINETVFIQIPAPLQSTEHEHIQIYEFESVPMPFEPSGSNNSDWTSIKTPYSYIGIAGAHYVLMTEKQMNRCETFSGQIICPNQLLQIHNKRDTCLYRLFDKEESLMNLTKICDIQIHHNSVPSPSIIETPHHFLISGFEGQWSIICQSNPETARQIKGAQFAMIYKTQLCGCKLFTEDLLISSEGNDCRNNQANDIKMVYPVNAFAWSLFNDVLDKRRIPDIKKLYDRSAPPRRLPEIKFFQNDQQQVLINDFKRTTIKLSDLQTLITHDKDIYLTQADKLTHKRKFTMWFKHLETTQIIMAIFSILGGGTTILLTIVIYKYCNLAGLVSGLAFSSGRAKAEQLITLQTSSLTDYFLLGIVQITIFGTIALIVYTIFRKIKKFCITKRYITPNDNFISKRSRTIIRAEISDGINVITLYVASIKAHAALLNQKSSSNEFPTIMNRTRGCFQDILEFDWRGYDYILLATNETLKLPNFITINFTQRNKLDKIFADNHTIRLLTFCEGKLWSASNTDSKSRQNIWYKINTDNTNEEIQNNVQTSWNAKQRTDKRKDTILRLQQISKIHSQENENRRQSNLEEDTSKAYGIV